MVSHRNRNHLSLQINDDIICGLYKMIPLIFLALLVIVSNPISAATTAEPHQKILTEDDFPSATKCAGCHSQIYEEWSSSAHAYAGLYNNYGAMNEYLM